MCGYFTTATISQNDFVIQISRILRAL